MTIHTVGGRPDDGPASLSQIDVEGSANDTDKVEVTLEVTGKELTRTVNVRKDGTWTARFKASQSTSLTGFACGALVAARVEASDGSSSRSEWVGCLECETDDDDASSQSRPEVRMSGDGAHDEEYAEGTPILVVERSEGGRDDDVLLRVKVADEAARSRRWPSVDTDSRRDLSEGRSSASGQDEGGPEADTPRRHADSGSPDSRDTNADRTEADRSERQEAEREQQSSDRQGAKEDEGTPLWLGGVLALSEIAVLLSLAAQGYPILIAFAIAVALPITAMFVAKRSPRAWAVWTLGAVGVAAVTIAALLPFVGFVTMDTYLIAAGIAAAGLLVGSGLLLFVGSDDDEDDATS